MELSELTAYARETYRIGEQHKWADFPGFSVLCHPQTGKWLALLMRQWDGESGTERECCDLRCGAEALALWPRDYLGKPLRMRGSRWIGIAFDSRTERELVFRLFDRAVENGAQHGALIVLSALRSLAEDVCRETPLPFADSPCRIAREQLPEQLRQLRRQFVYGRETDGAERFYRQARFMEDYEDDTPWTGEFVCFYPSYRDLNTRQLRGYFGWRSRVRRGEYGPIAASAAYLYLYELLNGVGAASPADVLERLRAFEEGFLDSGIGDPGMRRNLRRWMLEYAVLADLPPELARQAAEPALLARDEALAALRDAETRPDGEVFSALCFFGVKKTAQSPVFAAAPERARRLYCEAWRKALGYVWQGKGLFALCFGERRNRSWYPLANALYYERQRQRDRDYTLDACRSYHCRGGLWREESYDRADFDSARFRGFLHELDARLRRSLKVGRALKQNPADAWAAPYIDAAIEEDRRERREAEREKLTLDLSGLDRIRHDAALTRDSLLTGEEQPEPEPEAPPASGESASDSVLDAVQAQLLRALLRGGDVSGILKRERLTPALAADGINEALFDEIGDTVLLCEDERLLLVDDYTEELERLLGGETHG